MLKKLKEIKNGKIKPNRILIVGTNPLMCSNLLEQLINVYDFKFLVIPVNSNSANTPKESPNKEEEILYVNLPIECVVAESRCRNAYKGQLFDYFTNLNMNNVEEEDKCVIKGVDFVIYVFGLCDDLEILSKFFKINRQFGSLKILVVVGQNEEFYTLIQESKIELCDLQISCVLFSQTSNFSQNLTRQIFHLIFRNLI